MKILVGNEAERFIVTLLNYDYKKRPLRPSKYFPSLMYWNTTHAGEDRIDFPTIYIPKSEIKRMKTHAKAIAERLT